MNAGIVKTLGKDSQEEQRLEEANVQCAVGYCKKLSR